MRFAEVDEFVEFVRCRGRTYLTRDRLTDCDDAGRPAVDDGEIQIDTVEECVETAVAVNDERESVEIREAVETDTAVVLLFEASECLATLTIMSLVETFNATGMTLVGWT